MPTYAFTEAQKSGYFFGEEQWQVYLKLLHLDKPWIVCFLLVHWNL